MKLGRVGAAAEKTKSKQKKENKKDEPGLVASQQKHEPGHNSRSTTYRCGSNDDIAHSQ